MPSQSVRRRRRRSYPLALPGAPVPDGRTIRQKQLGRDCGTGSYHADYESARALFAEERRRTKVIPHAFGERATLKLMYAALIRASHKWRRVLISEFE
jgi:hypothetical protein